ncbi:hypothetical protein AB9E65_13735 [Escherichia coli]|uniref:hypothetical protein n=1 Tax=Escherichia coli TaxID=562 RepID=UPI0038B5FC96
MGTLSQAGSEGIVSMKRGEVSLVLAGTVRIPSCCPVDKVGNSKGEKMNKNTILSAYIPGIQSSDGRFSGKVNIPLSSFKLCVIAILCLCAKDGYGATYTAEKGKLTPLFRENQTLTFNTDGATSSGQGATLIGFTSAASTAINSCQSSSSSSAWSTSTSYRTVDQLDGYYGIKITDGVLLVPTNMNFISTMRNSSAQNITGTLTTDEFGNRSVSDGQDAMFSPNRWCSTIFSYATLMTNTSGISTSGSGSVDWAVYVSPTAAAGTYPIPTVYWTRAALYGTNGTRYLSSSVNNNSVQVLEPMSCTITQPDTIAFGEINLTGNVNDQVLAYSGKKNLVVNCLNGDSNPASISVTGVKGRYTDTLKMTMIDAPAEPAPAEIRGFIGRGAADWPGSGICDGSKNYDGYIAFDASLNQQIALENNLQPGVNNIPYSFTLCSNAGTNTGSATATATINLTWN